jgi:hypothetical protein
MICEVVLLLFGFYLLPATAQNDWQEDFSPLSITKENLHLIDAVLLALKHNPDIWMQNETTEVSKGYYMNANGQFDLAVVLNAKAGYDQNELTPAQWKPEYTKREFLRIYAQEAEKASRGEDTSLYIRIEDFVGAGAQENEDLKYDLERISDSLSDVCGNEINTLSEFFMCTSENARRDLALIGDIPSATVTMTSSLKIGLNQPFRNGIVLTPAISVNMRNEQFRGKHRDERLGGTGKVETYKS